MENKDFAIHLEQRTIRFAINIIQISGKLPLCVEGKVIRNQITKAGTSIGANYREANRSRSKADFASKIKISEGEASETIYWLDILSELNWIHEEVIVPVLKEANEILAIFTSISKNLRN